MLTAYYLEAVYLHFTMYLDWDSYDVRLITPGTIDCILGTTISLHPSS